MILTDLLQKRNTNRKVALLSQYFSTKTTHSLLDFGCGDLSLARSLSEAFPKLSITGIDVVDFKAAYPSVRFVQYSGQKIPFPNKSFDTVLSYHVLHHTDDPEKYFKECARVAKKRILLVEPIVRHPFELPFMKLTDWFFNVWKSRSIDMPFYFLSEKQWNEIFNKYGLQVKNKKDVEILPKFSPTGRSYLLELTK